MRCSKAIGSARPFWEFEDRLIGLPVGPSARWPAPEVAAASPIPTCNAQPATHNIKHSNTKHASIHPHRRSRFPHPAIRAKRPSPEHYLLIILIYNNVMNYVFYDIDIYQFVFIIQS